VNGQILPQIRFIEDGGVNVILTLSDKKRIDISFRKNNTSRKLSCLRIGSFSWNLDIQPPLQRPT